MDWNVKHLLAELEELQASNGERLARLERAARRAVCEARKARLWRSLALLAGAGFVSLVLSGGSRPCPPCPEPREGPTFRPEPKPLPEPDPPDVLIEERLQLLAQG